MHYLQVVIFSASIAVATCIGWVRFRHIEPAYFPFMACLSIATINEILSFFLTRNHYPTNLNNNIYVLLEALLLTVQFKNWGLFRQRKGLYRLILLLIIVSWFMEHTLTGFYSISTWSRIAYAFLIVGMSVPLNNRLILSYRQNLLRSPVFLICSGFIIYFTYKILVEAFWCYGLAESRSFRINVYLVLTWINLFVNLIYAAALLWIPKKPIPIKLS